MPTTPARARKMLRDNKAFVKYRTPFTIQLTYYTTEYIQPITLGVDAGSKIIGLSATTSNEELYSGEVILRNDIVDLLSTRREFRKSRRNRTTRYRAPRFNNRKKTDGWLAPSIENKVNTHIKVIKQIYKILPVLNIVVEVATFDIQKIKNPDIYGKDYQKGDQLGFWNVREYVLFRDNHICQHCKGRSKDKILNVHHIESRKTGGNAPNNLITLCETCHNKHHAEEIKLKIKRGQSFKDAAFMSIMRWAFYDRLKELYRNVSMTYGYITKNTRISNRLNKSHRIDARCISGNPNVKTFDCWYLQKVVRRHNRQIHKATISKGGYRKINQAGKYVFGFQLFDKVMLGNKECFIFGRRSSGSFDIRSLTGEKLSSSITYKKLKLLEHTKTLLSERKVDVPFLI